MAALHNKLLWESQEHKNVEAAVDMALKDIFKEWK